MNDILLSYTYQLIFMKSACAQSSIIVRTPRPNNIRPLRIYFDVAYYTFSRRRCISYYSGVPQPGRESDVWQINVSSDQRGHFYRYPCNARIVRLLMGSFFFFSISVVLISIKYGTANKI